MIDCVIRQVTFGACLLSVVSNYCPWCLFCSPLFPSTTSSNPRWWFESRARTFGNYVRFRNTKYALYSTYITSRLGVGRLSHRHALFKIMCVLGALNTPSSTYIGATIFKDQWEFQAHKCNRHRLV